MTSLTTIIGLAPMALGLGEGGELTAPLAITIMGGLSSAVFLTLVVIPVAYSLFSWGRRPAREVSVSSAGFQAQETETDLKPRGEEGHELALGPGFESKDMAQLIELLGKLFSSVTQK